MQCVITLSAADNAAQPALESLIGRNAATSAKLAELRLPTPPGFAITTEVCSYFYENGKRYPLQLRDEVRQALASIGETVGRKFGDNGAPLLVSVRSSARVSMPGLADAVLNVGLNDLTVQGLASASGDARFAWDSYRRLIQMYGGVVLDVDHYRFDEIIEHVRLDRGAIDDTELTAEDWQLVVDGYKEVVTKAIGRPFPQDPEEQLWGAISAVFGSWMNQRAITYRRLNDIPEAWGTAVNVQAMVFGNMGKDCATGVCLTRDPSTGENILYGQYLINAQGDEVFAGIRTTQPVSEECAEPGELSMERVMPAAYAQLVKVCETLERHYRSMQDIEFTVQQNRLYLLRTRNGKCTATASVRIAVEMAENGLIDRPEALLRVNSSALGTQVQPRFERTPQSILLARGLPASPGAVSGIVIFSADQAEKLAHAGRSVIFVRNEVSPEDIHAMHAAKGILTTRGDMFGHAAMLARGMGRPCVAGARSIGLDYKRETLSVGGRVIRVGDVISIDGNTGEVFLGEMRSLPADLTPHYVTLLDWADRARTLEVWAECKTTPDALQSKLFGADGMNLLYDPATLLPRGGGSVPNDSAPVDERSAYEAALAKFSLAYKDLVGEVLAVASGTPVAIRLIDATLGEFVWQLESGSGILRKRGPRPIPTAIDVPEAAGASIEDLNQFQLAITHEEIHQLQCRSIFDAAAEVSKAGIHVAIRIIIPFVLNEIEFNVIRSKILNLKNKICEDTGGDFTCHIGAGIDLPCAAFASGEIAKNAALLVFDSDHLTRATHGLPHADLDGLFVRYLELGLISQDPFISLDRRSVGQLLALACELAKNSQPGIKIGLSGRQGSDPPSVQICHELGFSYVSCPPAHVPAIRIAAAQAALQ